MEASSALKYIHLPSGVSERAETPLAPVIQLVRHLVRTPAVPAYDKVHDKVQVPHCEEETPWTVTIPHTLTSPYIHLIVPGFGGFKRSSRDLRNNLSAQEDVASLSFEPIRKGGGSDLKDSQKAHKDTIPAILQGIATNKELLNTTNGHRLDLTKVVLVPHSMGGISAVEHAVHYPDEVAYMIMMAVVGLEGKVGLGYARRLHNSAKHEIIPAISHGAFGGWSNFPSMAERSAKYYLGNLRRTGGEMASLYQVELRPKVVAIGALGVGMAMLNFEHDRLVSAQRSTKLSSHLVDFHQIAPGLDHLAPQTAPSQVAGYVGQLSRQLASIKHLPIEQFTEAA